MFFFNLSHTQKNFKYIDMHKVVLKTSVSLKKKSFWRHKNYEGNRSQGEQMEKCNLMSFVGECLEATKISKDKLLWGV